MCGTALRTSGAAVSAKRPASHVLQASAAVASKPSKLSRKKVPVANKPPPLTVNWVSDGIDRCRVGFLSRAYVPHAKLWDGVLCQVVFVGSADNPSSVVCRKCHHYCGYARVAVISALPGGAKVFEDKYEAMMD